MGKSVRYGRHGCCLPHNMQKAKRVNPSRSQTPYHWANKTGYVMNPARESNPESSDGKLDFVINVGIIVI